MFPHSFRFVGTVAELRKRLPFWRAIAAGQAESREAVPYQHEVGADYDGPVQVEEFGDEELPEPTE